MEIKVKLEVHCYRQNKLIDEIFDSSSINFIGSVAAEKIKKNRNKEFIFYYTPETTLKDFKEEVVSELFDSENCSCEMFVRIVGKNDWLFFIEDPNKPFERIISDEQIPIINNRIIVKIFVSFNAAEYDRDNRLRYYMNSNENCGHNEPHVHVEVLGENCEASIQILHPEKVKGEIPNKYLKQAKQRIETETKKFLEFWNSNTNGIKVDINQALGITEC